MQKSRKSVDPSHAIESLSNDSRASAEVEKISVPIPVAAQMLGCTVRAVRELLWAKKLPFKKIGKRFCIPTDALRSFHQRAA